MPGKIRFGMVGTGFIADWVLAGARQDARFEAVAICSRSQERADAFAAKHGIPHTFTSLGQMAASPLVDAVYIATPNFLPASQSILRWDTYCVNCGTEGVRPPTPSIPPGEYDRKVETQRN